MDYFIGDKTTITKENVNYFSEKIVYMPDQFQVNPISRSVSENPVKKAELGLPDDAIIFCCFNNNWKITPGVFATWMRILHKIPRSVLWLYAENPWASQNLVARAGEHGISGERLIFAKRIPDISDHFGRYKSADLFLDTFPYGAHTTASDALWVGLPLLTLLGKPFASRVAASLLKAVGLPELIAHSLGQYETLALEIAANSQKLKMLKERLIKNRSATPLFDTTRFTKYLESAYRSMYERYHENLPPDHIYVER